MNCVMGDIAIVVNDEPGCEANLGRLVKVKGRALFVPDPGFWWQIEPLGSPNWVCFRPSLNRCELSSARSTSIAIEDGCLRPIREFPLLEADETFQALVVKRVKES